MPRLIDADALIEKWANVHSKDMSFAMAVIGATNDVKNAPTIDAVPVVHGKWIDRNGAIVAPFWERYECSVCGARSDNSNYCSNCGARMDKE